MDILVVENSIEVTARLVDLLGDIDCVDSVDTAYSFQQALDKVTLKHHKIVITDLHLAGGSALDLMVAFHNKVNRPFIIVMSSYPYEDVRRRCLECGADYFLSKTDEFFQLNSIVKYLAGKISKHMIQE